MNAIIGFCAGSFLAGMTILSIKSHSLGFKKLLPMIIWTVVMSFALFVSVLIKFS